MVEQKALAVQTSQIPGGIEPVGGEQILAAASADSAHGVRSADLDHADGSTRYGRVTFGVDDPDFHAVERLSAASPCGTWHVGVGGIAAVRPEGLRHAEQLGPRSRLGALVRR